jgi:hypothetical protein
MAAAGRVLAPCQRPRTSAQEAPLIVSEEVWRACHRGDGAWPLGQAWAEWPNTTFGTLWLAVT